MLDDIIEIILELFFDIAIETFDNKRVPKPIRIISVVVIMAAVLGLCGLLIGSGINEGEIVLIILGVGLLVGFVALAAYKVIKHKRGRKSQYENKKMD